MPLTVGFFSYLSACAAYLVLTALLLVSWRGRGLGTLVIAASTSSAVWAGVCAAAVVYEFVPLVAVNAAELARDAFWCAFLLSTLVAPREEGEARLGNAGWIRSVKTGLILLCVGMVVLLLVAPSGLLPELALVNGVLVVWIGLAIAGMLLVEQIFRNSTPGERWAIKFLCLGVGGMFAYDFFMYADALLFRQLDLGLWSARGLVNAIAAPLIAISIARNPKFNIGIHVSRDVVFHTVTVFGAGAYLLVMAGAGYFIRFYGGSWGVVLQITFLCATGVLLLALLFSDRIRAQTRVFLSKHFFSYKYDYREQWLKFTQALAETTQEVPERLLRAIAALVSSPAGMLWEWRENTGYRLLARWNMPEPATEGGAEALESLARFVAATQWVIDLDEYARSPDIYRDLALPEWMLRIPGAWLIVPLLFRGEAQGFILLKRSHIHTAINWEDRDLLKTAGLQAASYLAQYQSDRALMQARQFEAFNRLSAYVVHDLKNILAQQALIVANAEKHKHKPAFVDDVIDTVRNSVARMTRLMEQLRSGARGTAAKSVRLSAVLGEVVERRSRQEPVPTLELASPECIVQADREQLATVFGHLVQNAQEATERTGSVSVRLSCEEDWAVVEIVDTGCGMDADFIRNRLFQPFDSTKGLTGMGVGAFESREFIRGLGGDIRVSSTPGEGSVFRVLLPYTDVEDDG